MFEYHSLTGPTLCAIVAINIEIEPPILGHPQNAGERATLNGLPIDTVSRFNRLSAALERQPRAINNSRASAPDARLKFYLDI